MQENHLGRPIASTQTTKWSSMHVRMTVSAPNEALRQDATALRVRRLRMKSESAAGGIDRP